MTPRDNLIPLRLVSARASRDTTEAQTHFSTEIRSAFRHRRAFGSCRGSRSRSRETNLYLAHTERWTIRMMVAALRALRMTDAKLAARVSTQAGVSQ